MTHTLHRYGPRQEGDYIVFAIPARGINDAGCEGKLQAFLRLAWHFNPVNMGDGKQGSLFRPERSLNPLTWFTKRRRHKVPPDQVIEEIKGPRMVAATFDSSGAVCAVLSKRTQIMLHRSIWSFPPCRSPRQGVPTKTRLRVLVGCPNPFQDFGGVT